MPVTWNDEVIIAAARRGAMKGVIQGANIVRNEILRLILNTPKTGRVYRTRGVLHKASAPGEPPASDTGELVRGISVVVDPATVSARVVSSSPQARPLEYGTNRMEPRPHMRIGMENVRTEVEAIIAEEVRKETGS